MFAYDVKITTKVSDLQYAIVFIVQVHIYFNSVKWRNYCFALLVCRLKQKLQISVMTLGSIVKVKYI